MRRCYRSLSWTAAAAILVSLFASSGQAQGPAAAESSALSHLKAYIEAFNSGVPGQMRDFFLAHISTEALKEIPVAQRLTRFHGAKAQLKSLEIERVVSDEPLRATVLARAANGEFLLIKASSEKAAPHNLLSLSLDLVEDPANIVVPEPKADEKALAAAVRDFLEARTKADEFSGVTLVAKGPRVVFEEAYGFADRDRKIPNRKDTKFNLGSINKIFTRVAIYQLARQGRLSLDDPIKRFLPDYPNAQAAEKVNVRQLLNMTSGIGDFFGDRFDATPKEKILTLQDYLPLFADRPLEFEPGTANKYSNGGYIVLGLIIEKMSSVDYYTYVRENIFKPCGMTDTDAFPRDAAAPNLARGYTRESEAAGSARVLNFATLPGRGSSAGGGYSTAEDMLKFALAVKDKKIYLPDAGSGIDIAGGAPGINSVLEWDPRSGFIIIVLTNLDPPTAVRASRQIAAWLPE
jgi:D-alanyl-D-alanine carboxypeptidase